MAEEDQPCRSVQQFGKSDWLADGIIENEISGDIHSATCSLEMRLRLARCHALFVPLRLAHGWVSLLSDAPIDSSRVWIDGLIWSIVLGWLIALIFGTIYNWIVARRALQEVS